MIKALFEMPGAGSAGEVELEGFGVYEQGLRAGAWERGLDLAIRCLAADLYLRTNSI
jgi:hypothetical protein